MKPAAQIPRLVLPVLILVAVGVAVAVGGGGCGKPPASHSAAPAAPAEPAGKPSSGNPLTAPVDYLGAVGAAQKSAARFADLTPVQQAVRAFQAGEDRLPATLQELVSEGYLPKLPTPPAGSRLGYDPQTGAVRFLPAQ